MPHDRFNWGDAFVKRASVGLLTAKTFTEAEGAAAIAFLTQVANRHPIGPDLDIGSLHRGPRSAIGDFFLPAIRLVRCKGMIKSFAIDVLRMVR